MLDVSEICKEKKNPYKNNSKTLKRTCMYTLKHEFKETDVHVKKNMYIFIYEQRFAYMKLEKRGNFIYM